MPSDVVAAPALRTLNLSVKLLDAGLKARDERERFPVRFSDAERAILRALDSHSQSESDGAGLDERELRGKTRLAPDTFYVALGSLKAAGFIGLVEQEFESAVEMHTLTRKGGEAARTKQADSSPDIAVA
jgi:hypothetical protein